MGRQYRLLHQKLQDWAWAVTILAEAADINIDSKYSFNDISISHISKKVLAPGNSWENKEIIGWGMGITKIESGYDDNILINVNDVPMDGEFRKIIVRD